MLSRQDILKLAGETGGDPRTIKAWATGKHAKPIAMYALEAACERLRIPIPTAADVLGYTGKKPPEKEAEKGA